LAGLDVLRLVNEPTAACLAYGLEGLNDGNIAVYDFGGGTFDVSILHVREALFEVLSTAGDTALGGDDIDRAVADALLLEGERSAADLEEALRRAEALKRSLTSEETATLELFDGTALTVTRDRFEEIVRPVVTRTVEPCRQALSDSGLSIDDIDEVVLVGGSTRLPLVRREVERFFGRPPHCGLDPDEVVAMGATIQAGILSGAGADMLLLDVVPLSLGIETAGGVMTPLVSRNSRIPASVRESFTTSVDRQTHVDIHVLQGERELASDCRSLARFKIPIEPANAGFPRVQVTFLVDANGILSVTAADERTGLAHSVEVKPSYGLGEDEIERMLEASIDHAEEDFATRQRIETSTEADMILAVTRKTLRERRSMVNDALRDKIEDAMDDLEVAVRSGDFRLTRERIEALNEASLPLAELIMTSSIKKALEAKSVDEILQDVREQGGEPSRS
jgi:molecular chaperone DnaK (HSP70)